MANKFTISTTFSAIDKMTGPIDKMSNKVQAFGAGLGKVTSKIGGGLKTAAIGITAISGAIGLAAKGFIEAGSEVEKYKTALTVMLGSQDAANQRFDEMQKFAATTPFELTEVVQLGNQLQALGKYSLENMTLLGDLASAAGKPIDQVTGAFAKLASGQKGVAVDMFRDLLITTDDWAKATGKGVSKSGELLATTEEMMAVLPKILEGKGFSGMMEMQSKTFNGKMSNMKDSVFQLQAAFGSALIGPAGGALEKIGKFITDLTDKVTKNADSVGKFFGQFFEVATGIMSTIMDISGQLAPVFQQFFPALLEIIQKIGPVISKVIGAAMPMIGKLAEAFTKLLPPIMEIVSTVADLLIPVFRMLEPIIDALLPVIEVLAQGISFAVKLLAEGLKPVLAFITGILDGIVGAINAAIDGMNVLGANIKRIETTQDRTKRVANEGAGATAAQNFTASGGKLSSNSTEMFNQVLKASKNQSTVDINLNGAPKGTTAKQTGKAPGVNLNMGFAGAR